MQRDTKRTREEDTKRTREENYDNASEASTGWNREKGSLP